MTEFGSPGFFGLSVLVVLLLYGVVHLAGWRSRAREAFAGAQAKRWPSLAYWPRSVLLLGAAVLIVIAAARPQWGHNEFVEEVEGIDLVIVLDISQSMTAGDVEPTRMAVAQDNLATLVEAQRGSRIGVVFFAGTAFRRSLLTTDTQAITQIIRRADREAGLTRVGSDLGAALGQAGGILAASENSGRAVLLVSDGEDHKGTFAEQAAALAEAGIVVYTAGVGTPEGAQLFDFDQIGTAIPKVDDAGAPVVSRLNEETLQAIAAAGGGTYVHLEGGATGLLGIRNDLARLDQTPLGSETQRIPIERFQLFAGAALVLLLLSWLLPTRLPVPSLPRIRFARRRHSLAVLLLVLLIGACGSDVDPLRERNEEANALFAAGEYAGALAIYQEMLAERPDVDQLSYNAGNALHRLDEFQRAVDETQRALPPTDTALGVSTYYALGNHLLFLGRLDEAYLAYRNALLLDPNDQDAKHNLELTLLLANQRDNPSEPGGEPTPGPGQGEGNGTPQAGEPTPGGPAGEGTPEASGTPGPGEGSPQPNPDGTPGGDAATSEQEQEAIRRALEEALAGIDEELTFEEAVRILDLLRQQQARQIGAGEEGSGPDY